MCGGKEKGMEVQGYKEPIPMAIKSEKISGQKNIIHSRYNSRHFGYATRVLKLLKRWVKRQKLEPLICVA